MSPRSIFVGIFAFAACLFVAACQKADTKVLIGGTARVSAKGPELQDSVIVVKGGKIQLVGLRKDAPITQDSERSDVTGKWIVPADGGTLEMGQPANLLVLNSDRAGDVARRMKDGEWQP